MRIIFLLAAVILQFAAASFDGESSPKSDTSDLSPRQRYGLLNGIQKEILDQWRGLRRRLVLQDPDAQSNTISAARRIFERLEELPYPLTDKLVELKGQLDQATSSEMLIAYMSVLIQEMRDYKFVVAERVIEEERAAEAF